MALWPWILGAAGGLYLLTRRNDGTLSESDMKAKLIGYFASRYGFNASQLSVQPGSAFDSSMGPNDYWLLQTTADGQKAPLVNADNISAIYNYVLSNAFPTPSASSMTARYTGPYFSIKNGIITRHESAAFDQPGWSGWYEVGR